MKSGKTGGMSGREMFMFNPSMVSAHADGDEEEEDGGEFDLNIRENDNDPAVKVLSPNIFIFCLTLITYFSEYE